MACMFEIVYARVVGSVALDRSLGVGPAAHAAIPDNCEDPGEPHGQSTSTNRARPARPELALVPELAPRSCAAAQSVRRASAVVQGARPPHLRSRPRRRPSRASHAGAVPRSSDLSSRRCSLSVARATSAAWFRTLPTFSPRSRASSRRSYCCRSQASVRGKRARCAAGGRPDRWPPTFRSARPC